MRAIPVVTPVRPPVALVWAHGQTRSEISDLMPASGLDPLARHAVVRPEKTAVIDDRPGGPVVTYTFAELDCWASRLAAQLHDLGASSTTKVAWGGRNSAELLVVICAIRRVGAAAVPVNYHLSPPQAARVLDDSDAEVIYVDAEYSALIERVRPDTPKLRHVALFGGDELLETLVAHTSPDGVRPVDDLRGGDIFYTSGTTGQPKGV